MPYMYMLLCNDGSLYTGSTWSLGGRLQQHESGRGARYTARRLPVRLLYYEEFDSIAAAFAREHTVQGWLRARKDELLVSGPGMRVLPSGEHVAARFRADE
ncbi:putative endonuclease [Microterricola gilva]|uniref:Putative endonuclease n=1 Tax=Microterricola gilva TaxID=393267 RepID=A0A4Q8APH6_9MICO|nr:GIY-YIG nuclease family protein [Microterricola gilva]RZU66488.1 putative endonuclease [Microterricola gilva]